MSIAEKLTTIAENQQKVYDAGFAAGSGFDYDTVFAGGREQGKQDAYDAFWDVYQLNGERDSYVKAFAGRGWDDAVFKPKYPLDSGVITNAAQMFGDNIHLSYVDYDLDFSNSTDCSYLFSQCISLKRIKSIKFNNSANNNYLFASCKELADITINGTIAFDISLASASKLSLDSLTSIINAYEAGAYTLALHATAKARLTDELKQIAADKGLTIK